MKTTAEIQGELSALQAELKTIEMRSAEIDDLQMMLKTEQRCISDRIESLTGINKWRGKSMGLIDKAELKLLESKNPIYDVHNSRIVRIMSVDKRWVELKYDGQLLDTSRYSRETGRRMRAHDDSGAIDAAKAVAIWNEHLINAGEITK